jgi:hypothetical protein
MKSVQFHLKPTPPKPELPTLSTARVLCPALVISEEGEHLVMIKVPGRQGHDTFLCLENGAPLMWSSSPDSYEFVRYLDPDETVVIPGRPYL